MRLKWITFLVPILALLLVQAVAAREMLQGSECSIGPDEVIEENLFVLCRTFTLEGHLKGNLFGAAFEVDLNGPVDGDIYLLGGQLDARNRIGRNLHFAGPVLRIHPTATFVDPRADLISLSLSTQVYDGARIPGSVISLSYQLVLEGEVSGEVSFWGSALRIAGQIDGDVDANVGDSTVGDASQLQTLLVPFRFDVRLIPPGLTVTESAIINGQLSYTSPAPGNIQGQIESPVIFDQIASAPDFSQINSADEETSLATWLGGYFTVVIREFISLGAIGVLAAFFLPRPLQMPVQHLRSRPLNSLGTGILGFILSIGVWVVLLLLILLVMLLFLWLSLPDLVVVGLITIGIVNVGGASLFYFVAVYISRIIVCLAAGRAIVRLTLGDNSGMLYLNLLAGVALLSILVFIPVIGSVINALVLALGLGALVLTLSQLRGVPRRQAAPVRLPTAPEDARQIPPPIVDETPGGPGMDNLPGGFRWWESDDSQT